MEVYVDYIVVKSAKVKVHPVHLERVFDKVKKHNMCLNLEKCFLRVVEGKFLGFMIT